MPLVGHWPLLEVGSTVVRDARGANDGAWVGTELVTNGKFPSDLTGWTQSAAPNDKWAVVSGKASIDGSQTGTSTLQQVAITGLVVGKKFTFSLDWTREAGIALVISVGGEVIASVIVGTSGSVSVVVTAATPVVSLAVSSDFIGTVDNVSIQELPDQSARPNGLGFLFDGVGDFVDIGDTSLNVKSVALLIKQDDVAGNEFPIDLDGTSYLSIESGVVTVNGFTAPSLYVNGIPATSGSTTITADTLNHIIITDTTLVDANNLDIGRSSKGIPVFFFAGHISDVRIYDHVLSVSEAKELFEFLISGRRNRKSRR